MQDWKRRDLQAPLSGNNLSIPPGLDEIEVSLFGPGYGESIVVHLTQNRWIIIDSCIDVATREVTALNYLRKIGVDPSASVKQVIATHWHDDHIRGLSRVVDECRSAEVVISGALNNSEFLTLVSALNREELSLSGSGVEELYKVLTIQESRSLGSRGIIVAIADRCIWRGKIRSGDECSITALSPCDAEVLLAKAQIAHVLDSTRFQLRRLSDRSPNHFAVVLWINVGAVSILLGSDLEETAHSATGWSVIVDSPGKPSGSAAVFKVPHHGSNTGHNSDIWNQMLVKNPIAILTPFIRGNVSLPNQSDIKRILSYTDSAFCTAKNRRPKAPRRPKIVEQEIANVTKYLKPISLQSGHIRLRLRDLAEAWQIELFGNAFSLATLAA